MVYKNFRVNCIVRVALLALTILVLFHLIFNLGFHISSILVGVIIIYQIYLLIHYIEKTNRYLTHFLEAIRYADFARSFQVEGLGSSFDLLKKSFNDVIKDFQKIRSEKEEHFHYLHNVTQHIGTSLIAFRKNGKVEIINNAAKKLFRINNLKNILFLEKFSKELVNVLLTLKSNEKALVKVPIEEELLELSIYTTEFKVRNHIITLVSIQNIQHELEEKEMEAWQKLIRVLTHEIMNSITPISSLSSTVNLMIKEIKNCVAQENPDKIETIDDIQNAILTIHKRSVGLMHFVESYRNLTRIPKPNFKIISVQNIFNNIQTLMEKNIAANNIIFTCSVEPYDLILSVDEELIEQVLINLIKNSIRALENIEDGKIGMKAFLSKQGKSIIQVIDNGLGISKEALDKIFVPFFTTSSKGSGIGLSLSRQIVKLHGGTISVSSRTDEETCFTLKF